MKPPYPNFFFVTISSLIVFFSCTGNASKSTHSDSVANQSYERLTPVLSFGEGDGESDEVFFQRVSDFTRHPDGRFFVLDSGQRKVFIFDANGNYLSAFGREGRGPMEFEQPIHIFITGNILYIYDIGSFTLKSFAEKEPLQWDFIKSISANPQTSEGRASFPVRVQPAGANLFTSTFGQSFSLTNNQETAPHKLITFDENGTMQHEHSITLPPNQMIMVRNDNMVMIQSQPLGYSIIDYTAPNGYYYAAYNSSTEFLRLNLTDPDAIPEVWAAPALPTRPNTPAEIARALENLEGEMLSQARDGIPELRPYFSHFVVCDADRLWIHHETYNAETNETRYVVYDPAQMAFTRFVSFEGRVRLNRIANGEILARGQDEFDQFIVHVFRL
jgi:hypothetical protein